MNDLVKMDGLVETFEIFSDPDNKITCRIDPMLFLLIIMVFAILLYIIQFKIN
jgi:hypothetical protein